MAHVKKDIQFSNVRLISQTGVLDAENADIADSKEKVCIHLHPAKVNMELCIK